MRILFLGDIVGRAGRDAVVERVPTLRRTLKLDFVIANGENAAGGYGITEKITADLYGCGVDCVTLGNHAWDQRPALSFIERDPRLIRPANFPAGTPGRGVQVFALADGRRILVVNLMGRIHMDPLDCPFQTIDRELSRHGLARTAQAILVDFHAEATSEKMAMGHHLDGRVSAVLGSHTHVPTADHHLLAGGTAYMTDAGMCADYDSVIGMRKDWATQKFLKRLPTEKKLEPADGAGTIAGALVVTDDRSGLATAIAPLRQGGRLAEVMPSV